MSDTKKIFQVLPKVMKEIGAISKNRKNEAQGYKFRSIDDLYNAVNPALSENNVTIIPEVLEVERKERPGKEGRVMFHTFLKMKFSFVADDTSAISAVTIGEAMDSSDKSGNKAMSAAYKYALMQVFCIPTEEEKDPDFKTPEAFHPLPNHAPQTQAEATTRTTVTDMLKKKFADVIIDSDGKPRCGGCNEALVKSSKKNSWYCPNGIKKEEAGRAHSVISQDRLDQKLTPGFNKDEEIPF